MSVRLANWGQGDGRRSRARTDERVAVEQHAGRGTVLGAALVVGLLISVFQVATQLQEMTLSYVPKLLVCAIVLLILGPWMIYRITQFALQMILLIPQLG